MAVDVEVTGTGAFAGSKSNVPGYSITEDSTPIDLSDSSGGTGSISFSVVDDSDPRGTMLLYGSTIRLTDSMRGTLTGVVDDLSSKGGLVSLDADTVLGSLIGETTADAVNGTFDDAIRYYLELGGLTDNIDVNIELADIPVVAKGWTDDLWTKIKELLSAHGGEIAVVRDRVVIRAIRTREGFIRNVEDQGWVIRDRELAKTVVVNYYESEFRPTGLVYPPGGWTDDVQVYSLDAGETRTENIAVNATVSTLEQPVAQNYVSRTEGGSVYCVTGSDNKLITAAQWNASGGKITVAIGEDNESIDVTFIAPKSGPILKYAPFRIAASAGSGSYYSSLRISGSGVFFNKQSVTVPTGAVDATRDIGTTVDNVFIRTREDALDAALWVARTYSTPLRNLTFTVTSINKPGELDPGLTYATVADHNALYAGMTIEDFNTIWAGKTIADYRDMWFDKAADKLESQFFGNANGVRVPYRRAIYRVRNVDASETTANFTAEADTTIADFNASAAGMTIADFNEVYAGLTIADFNLTPLPNVKPELDRV